MTCKVYKITNLVNGKIYVGITKERYLSHRFWAHANRKRSSGAYLHWSIQKYGVDNFSIEQVAEYDSPDESKREEIRLISELKLNRHKHPNGNGMNLTDGGDGSYGCKHSEESIQKMSGANNHNYGLTGAKNPTSRAVHQLTLTGEYIRTFGSLHEAARNLKPGCSKRQQSSVSANIMTVIKGSSRSTQAYGYKWAYAT
jgi:group I intron endonuclease